MNLKIECEGRLIRSLHQIQIIWQFGLALTWIIGCWCLVYAATSSDTVLHKHLQSGCFSETTSITWLPRECVIYLRCLLVLLLVKDLFLCLQFSFILTLRRLHLQFMGSLCFSLHLVCLEFGCASIDFKCLDVSAVRCGEDGTEG